MRERPASPALALVRREFLTTLRRRAPFWAVAITVVLCIVVAVAQWPSEDVVAGLGSSASQEILATCGVLLMAAVLVIVPGLAVGSITVEREEDTLGLLRLTLARPLAVTGAKLINSSGTVLLLLAAVVPVLSVVVFTQGLDLAQVFGALIALLVVSVTCAAIGLACGASHTSTQKALRMTYSCILFYTGLPFAIVVPFVALWNQTLALKLVSLAVFTPFGALLTSILGTPWAGAVRALGVNALVLGPAIVLAAYSAVITALSFAVAWRRLYRTELVEAAPSGKPRKRLPETSAQSALRSSPPVGWQAVLVREVQEIRARRRLPAAVSTVTVALVVLAVQWVWFRETSAGYGSLAERIWPPMIVMFLLPTLMAPSSVAPLLPKEWERDTFGMLRTTLLTPADIVLGKAAAGLYIIKPILVGVLVPQGLVLLATLFRFDYTAALVSLMGSVTFVAVALIAVTASTFAGASARRAGQAIGTAHALVLGLLFVFPGLGVILTDMVLRHGSVYHSRVPMLFWNLSPYFSYGASANDLSRGHGPSLKGPGSWVLGMSASSILMVLLCVLAIRALGNRLAKAAR